MEREKLFQLLAENVSDVIFTLDMELKYTFVSPSVEKLRGFRPDEVIKGSIDQTLTPESMAKATSIIMKDLEAEKKSSTDLDRTTTIELEMICKDGSTVWTEVKASFLRDRDGKPTGILGVTRDISERKRTEHQLIESEKRFREMAELLPGAIMEMDEKLMVTYANQVGLDLFGYTEQDLIKGLNGLDLLHPDDREGALQRLASHKEGHNVPPTEYLALRKDGSFVPVLFNAAPIIQEGTVKGFRASVTDISELRKVEYELKESERKHREILEGLNDVAYRMSIPDGNYEYCSNAAKDVFGYSADQFLNNQKRIRDFIHPDYLQYFNDKWQDLLEGKVSKTYEYKIVDPDNNERWIMQSNTGIHDKQNKLVAIEGLCRDITARKQAEEELRKREEQLNTILNSTDALVFMQDLEGRYLYFNGSDRFGLNAGDVVGKTPNDFFDAETAEKFLNRMQAVQKSGQKQSTESNLIWNGEQLTFVDEFSPVFDKDGAVIATSCFCHNVTDLKKVETDLRSSEQQFRLMFEKSPYAAALTDTHSGRILDVNEMFCTKTGFNKEEVTGHTTTEMGFYSEEDRNQFINHLTEHGTVEGLEMTFQSKSKILHTRMFARILAINTETTLLTAFEDITEIKETQDKLKQNEERLRLALSNAKEGIWDWYLDTNKVSFDEGYYTLAGYEPYEFPESFESWEDRVHPDDIEKSKQAINNCIQDQMPGYDIEFRFLRKDKSWMWIRAMGKVTERNENGAPARFTGTHLDISESKRKENQISDALKEKETLLQEIHHRVKNNLAVVSSLLGLQSSKSEDERIKNVLMDSRNRIQSMSLIHETLYQSESMSAVDMKQYLSKLANDITRHYQAGGKIQITVEADDIKLEAKQVSPIGLIVNEMLTNSIKYAFPDNQKGKINIEMKEEYNQFELIYSDNGIGIQKEVDLNKSGSMGFRLIKLLSEDQLDGSVELIRDSGTCFTIKFENKN